MEFPGCDLSRRRVTGNSIKTEPLKQPTERWSRANKYKKSRKKSFKNTSCFEFQKKIYIWPQNSLNFKNNIYWHFSDKKITQFETTGSLGKNSIQLGNQKNTVEIDHVISLHSTPALN